MLNSKLYNLYIYVYHRAHNLPNYRKKERNFFCLCPKRSRSLVYITLLQIPGSYIDLQRLIQEEVAKRKVSHLPPILTHEEFVEVTKLIPNNDITDDEDLASGT